MTIHNLYIFDRNGTLLFYNEWNRLKQSGMSREEEAKLMHGMLHVIKSFVKNISPLDPKKGFLCYKTNKYSLHYYETPTGLKFVLNTDVNSHDIRDLLQKIYSQVYVDFVVKNPVYRLDEPIKSELFKEKLDEIIKQSPFFTSRA